MEHNLSSLSVSGEPPVVMATDWWEDCERHLFLTEKTDCVPSGRKEDSNQHPRSSGSVLKVFAWLDYRQITLSLQLDLSWVVTMCIREGNIATPKPD